MTRRVTRRLLAVLALALVASCGSGPPTASEQGVDAAVDAAADPEIVCGFIYCMELAPAISLEGLGSLAAIDVVGSRLLVAARLGDGLIREYRIAGSDFDVTGAAIELATDDEAIAPEPGGLSISPTFSVVGDRRAGSPTIVFFDFGTALVGGSLNGALIGIVQNDLGADPSGPEIITMDGEVLVATADRAAQDARLRIFSPNALLSTGQASGSGALVADFAIGPFIGAVFFWQRVVVLVELAPEGVPRLLFIDLAESIRKGTADYLEVFTFSELSGLVGFHELPDGRLIFAFADGTVRSATLRGAPN